MPKLNTAEFITILAPQAIQARRDGSPLFPSVRIAQNILETGSNLNSHNNLGGFKVGSGSPNEWWNGATYTTPTWEVYGGKRVETLATWRSYLSVYHFYRDQDRLFGNSRYARVREAKTAGEQAEALYKCGYATDPQYADKLKTIMVAYGLYKYDVLEEDEEMTKEEKAAFDALAARVTKLEEKVPAPAWFVKEFGSADLGGKIKDPRYTEEGWRVLAIGARLRK